MGRAGTGKTYALDAARAAWEAAGCHVTGAALAARAAAELQAGAGIPSTTIDRLLADLDQPGVCSDTGTGLVSVPYQRYPESNRETVIQPGGGHVETISISERISKAVATAGLSQRALAQQTGISQPTLSRIISGERVPKMPELMQIAWATGTTVSALTGTSNVAERVRCAARATNGAAMDGMREALLYFLELDAYLEDQAIPSPA